MNKRDIISGTFFLILACLVLIHVLALGLGKPAHPQAGFFPFWAGFFLIVFCLALISANIAGKKDKLKTSCLRGEINRQKILFIVLALIIYAFLFPLLGYIPATFALLLFLFIIEKTKLWSAVVISLLIVAFSYILFRYLLKTPLPRTMGIL